MLTISYSPVSSYHVLSRLVNIILSLVNWRVHLIHKMVLKLEEK